MTSSKLWNDRIYPGNELPHGYRLRFDDERPAGEYEHYFGGYGSEKVPCPCCKRFMLAGWDLDMRDPLVSELVDWPQKRLTAHVCIQCDLYQDPYWIVYSEDGKATPCRRSRSKPFCNFADPYPRWHCFLTPLNAEDYPTNAERLDNLSSRKVPPGIYHQLGGLPAPRGPVNMKCRLCNEPMKFTGILDSDCVNFVFLDVGGKNGSDVSGLLIADDDCLDIFTCSKCSVIGIHLRLG